MFSLKLNYTITAASFNAHYSFVNERIKLLGFGWINTIIFYFNLSTTGKQKGVSDFTRYYLGNFEILQERQKPIFYKNAILIAYIKMLTCAYKCIPVLLKSLGIFSPRRLCKHKPKKCLT